MSFKGKASQKATQPGAPWPPYPPTEENELVKAMRVEEEREAKRVSDAIDRAIESERQSKKRNKKGETRLLLLGQSESGKSTLLKNFQLQFTPKALQAESDAWRAVIHLNLVRSVNFIIDFLSNAITASTTPYSTTYTYNPHSSTNPFANSSSSSSSSASTTTTSSAHSLGETSPTMATTTVFPTYRISGGTPQPAGEVRRFKLALSPLRQVEKILAKQLAVQDVPSRGATTVDGRPGTAAARAPEVAVRGGRGWKTLMRRREEEDVQTNNYPEELENARQILDACKADVVALWANEWVQTALREEGVVLQEQSGFFLDQAERVADLDYEPTFDDVLRARLQTMGIEEHRLVMETAAEIGRQWIFYDVGGSRGQRAAWVPFFDDVNVIIFMCSTAGFNEVLLEDRTVNRLLDSFNLWKTVCSSKLLAKSEFILILNKTDILDARLKAGLMFSSYVKSYKEANDLEHVTEYLKRKFVAMHHHHSPQPRQLHVHCTCAIDIETTRAVLLRIRDAILVKNLKATDLLS